MLKKKFPLHGCLNARSFFSYTQRSGPVGAVNVPIYPVSYFWLPRVCVCVFIFKKCSLFLNLFSGYFSTRSPPPVHHESRFFKNSLEGCRSKVLHRISHLALSLLDCDFNGVKMSLLFNCCPFYIVKNGFKVVIFRCWQTRFSFICFTGFQVRVMSRMKLFIPRN